MAQSYDVIVIGSGPGGYIAAIPAAQLGLKTAIVEREHLAGICSNWGCIPTKALLRSAEIYHYAQHPGDYGIKVEGSVTPDLKAIVARSRGIAQRMNGGVGFLMKKNKVDIIWGEAKITKPGEIVVSKTAKAIQQSTGLAVDNSEAFGALKSDAWDQPIVRALYANLRTTGRLGFAIGTAASASAMTCAAGCIRAQWNGAETGRSSARFAPLALAISTARSTAALWPETTT